MREYLDIILKWAYGWQALVGAAIPISFWFFIEWRKKIQRRKENLYCIEKSLVLNINMVNEAHITISRFINIKLNILIQNINEDIANKRYSMGVAFLPLFNCGPVDVDILKLNTGSGYLDNELLRIHSMSRDFAEIVNDLRAQFHSAVELHKLMALNKLNSPEAQGQLFKANVEEFITTIKEEFFNQNIKIYLRALVRSRTAANTYRRWGNRYWQFKFSPNYKCKFFRKRKGYLKYRDETFDRIDKYFSKEVEEGTEKIFKELDAR